MKIKKQVTATIELEDEDVQMLKETAELARQALMNPNLIHNEEYKRKLRMFLDKIFDI